MKYSKNPEAFIQISCSTKLENEEKMDLNDVWMRRENFDFSTIDEQYQFIKIETKGVRICPTRYCFRQPSRFVCIFELLTVYFGNSDLGNEALGV